MCSPRVYRCSSIEELENWLFCIREMHVASKTKLQDFFMIKAQIYPGVPISHLENNRCGLGMDLGQASL